VTINRKALYERCKGMCEFCGGVLSENWAAHHRKLRSQGGKDDLDNVVALHHECHNLGTNSVHLNPQKSYDDGFMVRSWADPKTTPLNLTHHWLVILTPDGEYAGYQTPKDVDDTGRNTRSN
jgi:hypothetical protein